MVSQHPRRYDVAVIGAGPAGSAAALALARQGRSVLLLEKAAFPRYKTCGGGLLGRARKRLPPGVGAVVEREFRSVALDLPGEDLHFVATRTEPMISMTMRTELDRFLALEARKAGACLVESSPARQIRPGSECVEITTEAAEFQADFVIGADGVHSATAKAAGWPELPRLAPALEWEIFLPETEFRRFSEMPRFDFGAIDAGYAWVFPKRDHLSAGLLSTCRTRPNLAAHLESYLKLLGITRIDRIERHGYLIPLAPRPGPLARERILLAGDAASLVDPVLAEGISCAVLSGQLAARALLEGRFDTARVARGYQFLLEDNLLGELRAGRILAHFLYKHPRLRTWAFRSHGQRLADFVAAVAAGERGYGSAVRNPASYLRLLAR